MNAIRLRTPRLELVAATLAMAQAEILDRAEFSRLLDATVPDAWPPETAADALPLFLAWLREHPAWHGWLAWYAIRVDGNARVLVGGCGFLGGPDAEGPVEMGYSVLSDFQRQGIATEMVGALAQWAFGRGSVSRIEAETADDNAASISVLARAGFVRTRPGRETGTTRFRRPR